MIYNRIGTERPRGRFPSDDRLYLYRRGALKAVFFANTDWYLYNFRLDYAKFLRSKGWEVVFVSPTGGYESLLIAEGFRVIPFSLSRKGINPFIESDTIARIQSVLAREKPDLVQNYTVKCVIYGSIAAKNLGINKIVNSITGLGYSFLGRTPLAFLIREIVLRLYRKALKGTQVLFENPDDQKIFIDRGLVTTDQSHVILGTGVNLNRFRLISLPENTPVVILPARMLWDKGVHEFVAAAKILHGKGIKARFALVGKVDDGNPASVPFERLTQWQKEGIVEIWGWQEDIFTVFTISNVVCLPSYREGLPKILLEAASCGRPIVATDVAGCREIVRDGVNGFLVPARSAEALADALEKLILDRELCRRMGIAGRKMVEEKFASEIVNVKTYAVYALLEQGGR